MTKRSYRKTAPAKSGRSPLVIVVIVAVVLIAAFIIWQQMQPPAASGVVSAESGLPAEISVAQAAALRDDGVFMLDVREPSEWNEAHVPDTVLVPLGQLGDRLSEIPTDEPIVIICRSGNRSAQARDLLLNAGYTHVTSVAGGVPEWQAQGHATVSGP